MEEIVSLIFNGCKLARDLELNLPNLANQPNIIFKSCDEIIRIFGAARDRLNARQETTSYGHMILPEPSQEWPRYSCSQAMDLILHSRVVDDQKSAFDHVRDGLLESSRMAEMARRDQPELEAIATIGGEVQPMEVADSGRGSSSQRPRRSRKDDSDKRIERVAAPRMGNTEIPPDDGYIWRKYGQKEILGARFPRGYYRCTHQKMYQCPARKQVQRLDNDPFTYEVIYRGDHTCTISSTAPSLPPPSTTSQPPPPPTALLSTSSTSLSHWLSMDLKPSGETNNSFFDTQMYRDFGLGGGAGTGGGGSGGAAAGPSTVRFGRSDVDYEHVVDLADVMFNSGSSSNNSMDLIFSPMEDNCDARDQKN